MHGPACARCVWRVDPAAYSRLEVDPDGRRTNGLSREATRLEAARTATQYECARSGARGDWYGGVGVTSRSPRSFDSLTTNEGPAGRIERRAETAALHSLLLFFKSA
jgi:hypothetical protein